MGRNAVPESEAVFLKFDADPYIFQEIFGKIQEDLCRFYRESNEWDQSYLGGRWIMMKRRVIFFALCVVAVLLGAGVASGEEGGAAQMALEIVQNAQALDLGLDNMNLTSVDGEPLEVDEKFLGLLRAKLRIARVLSGLSELSGGSGGYDMIQLLKAFAESGSVDVAVAPFDIAGYVIYHVFLPMQLEPVIRELPVYYRAVVSTEDWEEKFDKILDLGDLNAGKTFYLTGFPKVNKEAAYTAPVSVDLRDGNMSLYEFDSSVEAWLYSFWMRRYQDGSMETVKKILDWLNRELDDIAGAKG